MKTRTVRIRAVFRPDDPDAVNVLRLAAAANDLDILARMLIEKKEDAAAHGKRRYALRMTALHLSDVKDLLNHPDFDRVVTRCSRRRGFRDLPEAARVLRETANRGPLREVMGLARNGYAGHYDPGLFARALAQVESFELMDLPGQGCRHNVVDRLFDISLVEVSHARYRRGDEEESIRAAMNDLLDLHGALIPVVQGLVAGLYAEAEGF
jgi:hypothetical protein